MAIDITAFLATIDISVFGLAMFFSFTIWYGASLIVKLRFNRKHRTNWLGLEGSAFTLAMFMAIPQAYSAMYGVVFGSHLAMLGFALSHMGKVDNPSDQAGETISSRRFVP